MDSDFSIFLYVLSYMIIGNRVLMNALRNLKRGMVLDENFLMTVATVGAFAIGDYSEAVAVMNLYAFYCIFKRRAIITTPLIF